MKNQVEVDRIELTKAVKVVDRCLARKAVPPIIANLLIECKDGIFSIGATNLDSAASVNIPVKFKGEFSVTVHGSTFSRLIGTFTDDSLIFNASGDDFVLVRDSGDIKLRTAPSKSFPKLIFAEPDAYRFKFERSDLLEALRLAGFALETNESTYTDAFKGASSLRIFTNLIESKFELQSTNMAILSLVYGLCEKSEGAEDGELTIPKTALMQIAAILGMATSNDVHISDDANHLFLNVADVAYSFRKLTVQFPDMSKAKTAEFPIAFKVNSKDFLQTLKRMEILCDDKLRRVEMLVDEDEVTLTTTDADRGDIAESFEVRLIGGEPFHTAFNINYLMDVFARTDEDIDLRFAWAGVGHALKAQRSGDRVKADFFVQGLQIFNKAEQAAA